MNPIEHRLEVMPDVIREDQKDWKRFNIGQIVEVQGHKFRILAMDIVKQTIKLKVVKP